MKELVDEIKRLKEEKDAIIIVHNYQRDEVQDIADYLGDSLGMAKAARESDKRVIVVCGVDFMAETAKILSPGKTVLIPDENATCPMAHMIDADILADLKAKNPGALVMCYVNSSAEVKANSDICCTSANAVRLIEQYANGQAVIFIPDMSLGNYSKLKTGKNVLLYNGFCPTHHRILPEDVLKTKKEHPDALVVSHPECFNEVIELSDFVGSTSQMGKFINESEATEFIVCTEQGLNYRLQKENPDKKIYSPCEVNICPNMKKITLEKVRDSLKEMKYEVTLSDKIIADATRALERMFTS
ncbi:quinolinate synthase NadA [bacterium]|nr:quinolinate synthase NadA [bacterium]MBU1024915.1 quinolinate synthase NadA [bacterium]